MPLSKKELDVSFWMQGGGYGQCGCISRLRQQSGNRRLLLAARGPVVRHLPARLANDFDLTDGLLPAVCKAEMCSSVICCDVPKSAYSSGGLLWVVSQIDDLPCLACRALYLARFSDRYLHT